MAFGPSYSSWLIFTALSATGLINIIREGVDDAHIVGERPQWQTLYPVIKPNLHLTVMADNK